MPENNLTLKEAILKGLEELKKPTTYKELLDYVKKKKYYVFSQNAKTPDSTVSANLSDFILKGDSRVKRIKVQGGGYAYFLSKDERDIDFVGLLNEPEVKKTAVISYEERALHKLFSSYLNSNTIYSKTIFHERSSTTKDSNQKWVHPDMVGIEFKEFDSKIGHSFLKTVNRRQAFNIYSYELKKEINTDYELKNCFFQAVSNSSWANYGYLVAFDINGTLFDEMERLSQSFGIGVIKLNANPFESKILYPGRLNDLDFKTIDKLCAINKDFADFIEKIEKLLIADDKFFESTKKEFSEFCDSYFETDSETVKYCRENNIPIEVKPD